MCNESMQGMKWAEQCQLVAGAGYKGIEIAPFSLVKEGIEEISPRKRQAMVASLKNAGLECVGLHWVLSPPPRGLKATSPSARVRNKTWSYLHKLIDFCGDLGGKVMVFGSPKGRSTDGKVSVAEATGYLAEGLTHLADHARDRGVKILVEPLSRKQTDVINTTAEAMKIVKEINHPAIQTMFDFHHALDEGIPFHEILVKYHLYIGHIHVQEIDGSYLGTGNGAKEYVRAFQVLKELKYDQWISLEVFDFSPGPKTIAKESMKTLRAMEEKLK